MSAILFAATSAPPMNTGCVTVTAPANIFRVSVLKPSTRLAPTWFSAPANCPMSPAVAAGNCDVTVSGAFCSLEVAIVPRLLSASFWSSLSKDISLLIHMYPPTAFTFGRYCVRADFRRLAFTSCFTFATPICLLFLSAIALQLSSVNSRCVPASDGCSAP